tara:strand:+ start:247 stop:1137 length:891 start_codon:yes stop_codon:yes gene_type:complete
MKERILIQLFPMVGDIDYLEKTLFQLTQNSPYIDRSKFHIILDVTYPMSDYFTNWEESKLDKSFFIKKFESLKKYGEWYDESYFNIDYEVKGCVDLCVNNIYKYDVDSILMLDIDIIFNPQTLNIILESSLEVSKTPSPHYIITPEYTKLWDNSWDPLVNDLHLNTKYDRENDPIINSSLIYGDLSIEPLLNKNEKVFKFGGGWFTLFSKPLLDSIEFPRDLYGYGAIDTFIMLYCNYVPNATQYKVKNLVVCEDKKFHGRDTYSSYIKTIDRKNENKKEIWDKLISHLNNKLNEK